MASAMGKDIDFLELAEWWANRRSKDPSSKVCALITRPDGSIASSGYNGFAKGLPDDTTRYADRGFKMATVIHAEENALLFAREPLDGYTCYVHAPLPPCAHCAALLIQKGIGRVVAWDCEVPERWQENVRWAIQEFTEAGVPLFLLSREGVSRRVLGPRCMGLGTNMHLPSGRFPADAYPEHQVLANRARKPSETEKTT